MSSLVCKFMMSHRNGLAILGLLYRATANLKIRRSALTMFSLVGLSLACFAENPSGDEVSVVMPAKDAILLDIAKTAISGSLRKAGGLDVIDKNPVYWRMPNDFKAGKYYPCFRFVGQDVFSTDIIGEARHNGAIFKVLELTDPVQLGEGFWKSDLCASEPLHLNPGDIISGRVEGQIARTGITALILRSTKPPKGHLRIGTSTWGMYYQPEVIGTSLDVSIEKGPDASRSGTAKVTVMNHTEKSQNLKVEYRVKDFFGKELVKGKESAVVPSLGLKSWIVQYAVPEESNHILVTATSDGGPNGRLSEITDVVIDRVAGNRPRLLLSGQWDFAADDSFFLERPPEAGKYQKNGVTVPGYTPLPPRGAKHVGWYRKTFDLPKWLKGDRKVLIFGSVLYECDVYVNGTKVGNHFGPKDSFEFDVTNVVKQGTNEIVVGVRDWIAAVEPAALRAAKPGSWNISTFLNALIAPSWDSQGGIKDDVWLEGRASVSVSDSFVQTSFRNKTIDIDATISNKSGKTAKASPVCVVYDQGKEILRIVGKEVEVVAGTDAKMKFSSAFPDAPLWWPEDPRLLRCAVSLGDGGDVLDVRFGFREIWFQENHMMFNGRSSKMVRTGYNPYSQQHMNRRTMRELVSQVPPFGVSIVEVGNPMQMTADICDEEGLLWDLCTNAEIVAPTTETLLSDTFWKNAEKMAVRTAVSYRNHPCVVEYDNSNEFACFSPYTNVKDGFKFAAKRLFGIFEAIEAVDPTRLQTSDADGDLDGLLQGFNLHYVIDGSNNIMVDGHLFITPVDAFNVWFEKPSPGFVPQKGDVVKVTSNGYPFTWKFGERPVHAPEVLWCPFSSLPHGGTYWRGDNVYSSLYDCYQAEVDRINTLIPGHRHMEMWMIHPWTAGGPVYDSTLADCVVPIESLHNYYSGEKIVRHVNVHHDRLTPLDATLTWSIVSATGEKTYGEELLKMESGGLVRKVLEFTAPTVSVPTQATLRYKLTDGKKTLHNVEQAVTIFPKSDLKQLGVSVSLWDPAGTTGRALSKLGVKTTPVADLSKPLDASKILVVGDNAFTDKNKDAAGNALFGFVKAGGTVLTLHQTQWPEWSPASLRLDQKHAASRVWKRSPSNPVFKGIEDSWLRDWRESHAISNFDFIKPVRGNVVTIADSGLKDGLERSGIIELSYGTGRLIASQFRLVEAFDIEPVAPLILANLIETATIPSKPLGSVELCADEKSPLAGMLKLLKAEVSLSKRPLDGTSLAKSGVIIVQLDGKTTADEAKALHGAAEAGTLVWIRGVDATTLGLLDEISGLKWGTYTPLELWQGRGLIEGSPVELAGLSNGDFFWKQFNYGDSQNMEKTSAKLADLSIFQVRPTFSGAATEILYPSQMWVVKVGKGKVIVDQTLWAEKVGEMRSQAMRIGSAMLTNAGVTIAPDPVMTKLPDTIVWQPIDLAPYGNMGFKDDVEGDGKGGWSDQGPMMDMRRMPTGDVEFNDVPFRIDPIKGCLTMQGQHQAMRDAFPVEFKGIKIDRKVVAIEILHSGAWVSPGLEIFKAVVRYDDGSTRDIDIIGGTNTIDWTYATPDDPFPLETETQTRCGWTGKGDVFKNISVWQSRWINPTPDKKVTTIDLVHRFPVSVAIVCGLTVGVEGNRVAVAVDPRTPEQLLEAVAITRKAGKLDEALKIARILCRKAPLSTENWNLLGSIMREMKDERGALKAYRKSLEIQPNQPDTMTFVQELQDSTLKKEGMLKPELP